MEEQGYPGQLLLLKSLARRMICTIKNSELIASANHLGKFGSSCLEGAGGQSYSGDTLWARQKAASSLSSRILDNRTSFSDQPPSEDKVFADIVS